MQLFSGFATQLLAVLLVLHRQNVKCEENSLGNLFGFGNLVQNFVKPEANASSPAANASSTAANATAKSEEAANTTISAETAPTNATAEAPKNGWSISSFGLLPKIVANKAENSNEKSAWGIPILANLNLFPKNGPAPNMTTNATGTETSPAANATVNSEATTRNAADAAPTNETTSKATDTAANTTTNTTSDKLKGSWLLPNLNLFSKNGTIKTENAGILGGWLSSLPKRLSVSEDKKEEPLKREQGWLSRFRANLISSSSDLNELPPAGVDQSPKEASKANLPNLTRSTWKLSKFNLTNLTNFSPNFTISNWELLLKWNSAGFLNTTNPNLNSSKDWLENYSSEWFSSRDWLVGLKARYYGNLLNSSASDQATSSAGKRLNATSPTTPPSAGQTAVSTPANPSDEASMSIFRSRLLRVYDSLTFCEHPCNGKRVKKNANALRTINGCGPSYFSERQLSMIPYGTFFRECCDAHDSNYAECGFKKQEADYRFLDCMLGLINRTSIEEKNSWPKIRRSFGYALFGMVDLFGCKAFAISQREVCSCG